MESRSSLEKSVDSSQPQAKHAGAILGHIYSFTIVQDVPQEFAEFSPYVLALIELDDGAKVTAQLTDIDSEIAIGDRVEMVTRKLRTDGSRGMIIYGYKFRPLV